MSEPDAHDLVLAVCPGTRNVLQGTEAQTSLAPSALAPEIQISQSGIWSWTVLKAVFYSVLLFSMVVAKTESSPGPPPIPSHLVQSPGSSSLLFPFYFPDQTLALSTPSLPHWLLWPACELACVLYACPWNLASLAPHRPSVLSSYWVCVFLILSCSALLLGIGLQWKRV